MKSIKIPLVFSALLGMASLMGCSGGGGGNTPTPTPTPSYIIAFVAGAGGAITGVATQSVISGASASAVTAVPSSGYTFTNWTGTGLTTSPSNPLVVANVTQALTVTANFSPIPTHTVTFLAGPNGAITGVATQSVISGASASAVTAVPSSGYTFTNWTGTGSPASSTNPLLVTNVTSDLTITANFSSKPATALAYVDPAGDYSLKRNTALSTATHLVLDLVGPAGTGSGLSACFSADPAKVTWVPVDGTMATLIQNGTQFNLGAGTPILKAMATSGVLQAALAQKSPTPAASMNGTLLRVALDLKAGLASGTVIALSADASKCQVLDAAGNISSVVVAVGALVTQ